MQWIYKSLHPHGGGFNCMMWKCFEMEMYTWGLSWQKSLIHKKQSTYHNIGISVQKLYHFLQTPKTAFQAVLQKFRYVVLGIYEKTFKSINDLKLNSMNQKINLKNFKCLLNLKSELKCTQNFPF